jgi:endonuclease/exonuclease/phosphatase family metal-dependent hydrolase
MRPIRNALFALLAVGCAAAEAPDEGFGQLQSGLANVLPAAADTRLEEKNPNGNYASAPTLWAAGNVNGACQLAEAALKFDVSAARGKTIRSAKLRLYVTNASADGHFELFRLGRAWSESSATWNVWTAGSNWTAPGANGTGDRGSGVRGSFVGTGGTGWREFPLNAYGVELVQGWIDGTSVNDGLLLRPTTSSPCTNAGDDFAFSSRETSNPPQLIVEDGTATTPPPPSGSTIKVVTWNVWDGHFRADGQDFLVRQKPDVAFLQEVDADSLITEFIAKLEADRGGTWYWKSICRGTDSCASKVAIVSRFPLGNIGQVDLRTAGTYVIPCYSSSAITWAGRRALGATITVNGRTLSVISTRMSSSGSMDCVRTQEVATLESWASANYPLPHIIGGDFNQQPSDPSAAAMLADPLPNTDSWAEAVRSGGAIPAFATLDSTPDINTPTHTYTRLDYVYYTRATPYLALRRVDIIDSGGLSDHRAMEATFDVR